MTTCGSSKSTRKRDLHVAVQQPKQTKGWIASSCNRFPPQIARHATQHNKCTNKILTEYRNTHILIFSSLCGGRLEEGPQPLGWSGVLLPVLREEFGELSPGRLHHSLAVVRGEPLVPKVLQQLAHDVHESDGDSGEGDSDLRGDGDGGDEDAGVRSDSEVTVSLA